MGEEVKKEFFKILYKYIHQYGLVGAVFILFGGIFAAIFSLYQLEAEAVIYASILCLFCGIIIVGIHFIFYYRKHNKLKRLRNDNQLLKDWSLNPSNLIEKDLCDIIMDLLEMNQHHINEKKALRTDSIDYYTTWVHQIKAPIAVMKLILQEQDTVENKELLSELFRIEQYTDMVLCYFRLDSSSTDFVIQEYDLDTIIRQVIHKFAPQFIRKRIRLNYERTKSRVITDEKWLVFILEQLFSNAVKYTETGSITITVTDDKVLSITDTGIGIAFEDLPRIFQKGFTGYNGHADKKATGLGLYLCKQAADKLCHKLQVTSIVGHGTKVSIDLHSTELEVE